LCQFKNLNFEKKKKTVTCSLNGIDTLLQWLNHMRSLTWFSSLISLRLMLRRLRRGIHLCFQSFRRAFHHHHTVNSRMSSFKRKHFNPPKLTDHIVGVSELTPSAWFDCDGFEPLPAPTHEDDHAAQFALDRQTFDIWRRYYHIPINGRRLILAPVGSLDADIDVALLMRYLGAFFPNVQFDLHEPIDVTDLNLRSRQSHRYCVEKYLQSHRQFCVDQFDRLLLRIRSQSMPKALAVVGMTMFDLHMDETDEFTMGCADGRAGVAIFSFARYQPTFEARAKVKKYHTSPFSDASLSPEECRKQTTLAAFKTMTHEILHLLGIDHCAYASCLMNGSGHLAEDRRIPLFLCPVDLHKLAFALMSNTGTPVDLEARYRAMLDILRQLDAHDECAWLERRLAAKAVIAPNRPTLPPPNVSVPLSSREMRALKRRMLTATVQLREQ
jgi:predicted Zn-dependent protease